MNKRGLLLILVFIIILSLSTVFSGETSETYTRANLPNELGQVVNPETTIDPCWDICCNDGVELSRNSCRPHVCKSCPRISTINTGSPILQSLLNPITNLFISEEYEIISGKTGNAVCNEVGGSCKEVECLVSQKIWDQWRDCGRDAENQIIDCSYPRSSIQYNEVRASCLCREENVCYNGMSYKKNSDCSLSLVDNCASKDMKCSGGVCSGCIDNFAMKDGSCVPCESLGEVWDPVARRCVKNEINSCASPEPTGDGKKIKRGTPAQASQVWVYDNTELSSCSWSCDSGYVLSGENCIEEVIPPNECTEVVCTTSDNCPGKKLCVNGILSTVCTKNNPSCPVIQPPAPQSCPLTSAVISLADDKNTNQKAETGDLISIVVTSSNLCTNLNKIQIDASETGNENGQCVIKDIDGRIKGMGGSIRTASPYVPIYWSSWAVPSIIPAECKGKTIKPYSVGLYSGEISQANYIQPGTVTPTGSFIFVSDVIPPDGDCQDGTTKCQDGICKADCGNNNELSCNSDNVCDVTESCTCSDCYGRKDSCNEGSVCDSATKVCKQTAIVCGDGTTKCQDGTCKADCGQGDTNELSCNSNNVCDVTESCTCSDCYGRKDSCEEGSVCDSATEICKQTVIVSGTPVCGNGIVESGEECDCGPNNYLCSYQELNGQSCRTLGINTNGQLSCYLPSRTAIACKFNREACDDPTKVCSGDVACTTSGGCDGKRACENGVLMTDCISTESGCPATPVIPPVIPPIVQPVSFVCGVGAIPSTTGCQCPEGTQRTSGYCCKNAQNELVYSPDVPCNQEGVSAEGRTLAAFSFDRDGLKVKFTSTSIPVQGTAINYYEWNFGDDSISVKGPQYNEITHTYQFDGPAETFLVSLLVHDSSGGQDQWSRSIEIEKSIDDLPDTEACNSRGDDLEECHTPLDGCFFGSECESCAVVSKCEDFSDDELACTGEIPGCDRYACQWEGNNLCSKTEVSNQDCQYVCMDLTQYPNYYFNGKKEYSQKCETGTCWECPTEGCKFISSNEEVEVTYIDGECVGGFKEVTKIEKAKSVGTETKTILPPQPCSVSPVISFFTVFNIILTLSILTIFYLFRKKF